MLKELEKCFYGGADKQTVRKCLKKYDMMRASNLINLDRLMKIGEEWFGYGSAQYYQFLSSWVGLARQGGSLRSPYMNYGLSYVQHYRYTRRRPRRS